MSLAVGTILIRLKNVCLPLNSLHYFGCLRKHHSVVLHRLPRTQLIAAPSSSNASIIPQRQREAIGREKQSEHVSLVAVIRRFSSVRA